MKMSAFDQGSGRKLHDFLGKDREQLHEVPDAIRDPRESFFFDEIFALDDLAHRLELMVLDHEQADVSIGGFPRAIDCLHSRADGGLAKGMRSEGVRVYEGGEGIDHRDIDSLPLPAVLLPRVESSHHRVGRCQPARLVCNQIRNELWILVVA